MTILQRLEKLRMSLKIVFKILKIRTNSAIDVIPFQKSEF